MALGATKWQVQTGEAIRYIGGDHETVHQTPPSRRGKISTTSKQRRKYVK